MHKTLQRESEVRMLRKLSHEVLTSPGAPDSQHHTASIDIIIMKARKQHRLFIWREAVSRACHYLRILLMSFQRQTRNLFIKTNSAFSSPALERKEPADDLTK